MVKHVDETIRWIIDKWKDRGGQTDRQTFRQLD